MQRVRSNLSLALGGLLGRSDLPVAGEPRALMGWAGVIGCSGVQIDATAAGLRAREMDRSARRDLVSVLLRAELAFTGLDVFVPPAHFVEAANVDRAVTAAVQAIEMAGEMAMMAGGQASGGGRVVSMTLPAKIAPDVLATLNAACEKAGVMLADHAWPAVERTQSSIGVGIDPSAVVLGGESPGDAPLKLKSPPVSARVSDLAAQGRVAPGSGDGKMDLLRYKIALDACGYRAMPVLDLRGLQDVEKAAERIVVGFGGM